MKKATLIILSVVFIFSLVQFATAQESEEKECSKKVEESGMEKISVQMNEIEPFYYCAVEMTGSYEQHATGFQTLYSAAGEQGISMEKAPFGIYYNDPTQTPEDSLKWEIGLPLSEKREVAAPLTLKMWEYNTIISKEYEGSYSGEAMTKTYQELFGWMGMNQYTVVGPVMEKFLSAPAQNEDGEWSGKVEVNIPVMKIQKE